jgi:hypothetical protein
MFDGEAVGLVVAEVTGEITGERLGIEVIDAAAFGEWVGDVDVNEGMVGLSEGFELGCELVLSEGFELGCKLGNVEGLVEGED